MHLKTLTLRGFKSFASTTTLRLESGITCVVGPNGSGKSNVVDALAWVMGEQGAKTLRGGQMADVIFAGTSARPALGRAQVELTIDNTDGALPIDYSEVTISRTLFRGGGSEYSINGAPARLLDIQELLSDTGMGRQMHVIVGQGQLDAILSSTPEERRGFIEEAAGVLKHRRRKDRALRKLADMDQNLVRVLDLTNEIHRQLKPLARQARAARRASAIQARLRDARARLLADDLQGMQDRLAAQEDSDRALARRLESLTAELARERGALEAVGEQERASNPRLESATSAWRELTTLHERLAATAMLAAERVSALSVPPAPPGGDDPDELERRAQEATAEDTELLTQVEAARGALEGASTSREEAESAEESAARELARVNRVLADHREKVARLTGDVSSARSRLEAARAEAGRATELHEAARARQEEAERRSAGTPAPPEDGQDPAATAHTRAAAARDAARARVDALLAEEREARAQRARWEARRDTLAESLTPEDATADLVHQPGILGEVPSFLRVEQGWEDAVSALLAPFADAAVADALGTAVDRLRDARARGAGRVRMLLADPGAEEGSGATGHTSPPRATLPHGARWALDVITPRSEAALPLEEMLDGAVVCADLDQVPALLGLPGVRVVATGAGDVLRDGAVVGAGAGGTSVLTLHAQHEEAVSGARAALGREHAAEAALVDATADLDAAVHATNEALRSLRAQDAERARATEAAARAASAASAAAAETERSLAGVRRAQEQVEWAQQQVLEAEERLGASTGIVPDEDLSRAQHHAEECAARARAAREEETTRRLALRTTEERSRQAQGRARALRQGAARAREELVRRERSEALRLSRLERTREVAGLAQRWVAAAAGALARADQERTAAEEAREQTSRRVHEVRGRIDTLTRELTEVTGVGHRDEIARAELDLRMEQLRARIVEEVGLEPDQLIEEYGPHNLVPVLDPGDGTTHGVEADAEADGSEGAGPVLVPFVREEQERLLERARRELERLGRVNPLALEEHEALSRRHEFLVSQVQDLKSSKADLLHIIDDVDTLVEEAFAKAFQDTQREFAHTFEVLFPGGEGNLVLTEPEDMLSTGIEIEARPAGKRVKRLSLLSGGERSLAALAFLVAIFKARPSPFYVMDEVEAALDDVNLSRLLEIFRELQESSQLIVITHQKRTMEIADALYGVTMRDGVTRVVSQRLSGAPATAGRH